MVYPKRFDQMFVMLGSLDIEMGFMSAIGDWVIGNGWVDIFIKVKLSTVGLVDYFWE